MPERKNITLYEGNIEKAVLTITRDDDGQPQDLNGATVEVYIKSKPDIADNAVGVVVLSNQTTGVELTTPTDGICTVTFPDNIPAGTRWWRVDVILNSQRKTAAYGSLTIENT